MKLTLVSITFLLFLMVLVLYLVKKRRISIKYSFVWLLPCIVLMLFAIVPGLMSHISNLLGFQTASNMILTSLIGFLMVITIALTVIVSNMKDKIRLLIQEVSILKSKEKKE